jgi:hypothetical protein
VPRSILKSIPLRTSSLPKDFRMFLTATLCVLSLIAPIITEGLSHFHQKSPRKTQAFLVELVGIAPTSD